MANSLTRPYGDYYPYGISQRVPNMQYAADVSLNAPYCANFGAPLALSANAVLAAFQNVNGSAGAVSTFTAATGSATAIGYNGLVPFDSTTIRNGWGRNLTCTASTTCTRTVTVTGYDYLGSKLVETMTLNGTATIQGLKAFQWVESVAISSDTDTATVSIGYGNKFGLPYKGVAMDVETKNGAIAANAGTFVAGLADATAETATNADVRGTYLPVTVIPDGTNTFEMWYITNRVNLHGQARYAG